MCVRARLRIVNARRVVLGRATPGRPRHACPGRSQACFSRAFPDFPLQGIPRLATPGRSQPIAWRRLTSRIYYYYYCYCLRMCVRTSLRSVYPYRVERRRASPARSQIWASWAFFLLAYASALNFSLDRSTPGMSCVGVLAFSSNLASYLRESAYRCWSCYAGPLYLCRSKPFFSPS